MNKFLGIMKVLKGFAMGVIVAVGVCLSAAAVLNLDVRYTLKE